MLRAADRATEAVERHRTGQAGRLRLGFQASGAGALITALRGDFQAEHPGVVIESRSYAWGGEVPALRAGEVDLAIVWQPHDLTDLASIELSTEPRFIGLPVGHPLATRRILSIMEVKDVPLAWTQQAPQDWVDWWAVNPRPDGSSPTWGAENRNVEELLDNAAADAGASISPASMAAYYQRPDLAWIPLTDVEPLHIDLAWDPEQRDPLVTAFVDLARHRTGSQSD